MICHSYVIMMSNDALNYGRHLDYRICFNFSKYVKNELQGDGGGPEGVKALRS